MRWLIHGTDAVTGQEVELALDEQEASRAVKSANDRQIVVDRITSARSGSIWRIVAGILIVALAGVAAALLVQNLVVRHNLEQALDEQTQLSQSVSQAEQTVNEIRTHGNLAANAATQASKLAEELANSRRISSTEQQLTAARQKVIAIEETAARVPELERQLVALHEQLSDAQRQLDQSRQLAEQFRTQTVLQGRRLDQLEQMKPSDEATAKIAQLDNANKDLAGQIDKLKSELLIAAARSTAPDAAPPLDPTPPVAAATPWALGMTFDAARDYLLLNVDRESAATVPAAGGLFTTYGVHAANAVRVEFVHDKTKDRVYSGTLTVALAADTPKDKLDENRKAVADFLQAFAPGIKAAGDVLVAAGQLSAQDDSHRLVILGADAKLTLWNNKGAYTFHVESPRGDAE
jgi:uncharacterized phage infection (PIP) family protein YhgE